MPPKLVGLIWNSVGARNQFAPNNKSEVNKDRLKFNSDQFTFSKRCILTRGLQVSEFPFFLFGMDETNVVFLHMSFFCDGWTTERTDTPMFF